MLGQLVYRDGAAGGKTSIAKFGNYAERSGNNCMKHLLQMYLCQLRTLVPNSNQLQDMGRSVVNR